ncbi:MAG TPA: sensor domain-containing diguanylate cyclase [Solirubrobacteraceae bacterium]|nr:sensor domain-containing diguanylate cyclase [Solirubrobacteraceae bacterium]
MLSEIARTISEALGFQGVAFNLYRPAWDDFIVSTVYGSEAMCETLLGETYGWSVWDLPLEDRFERRGAYFIPHGSVDWSDPELGARYVPDRPIAAGDDAWVPGDELFVPCRHSDGHLLGIVSVGEPVSGMRPSDDQLDLLVAMVSLTARALQGAQEAVEAARHRIALEQLLQISSRLSERRSIDEVLQEVCDGVAGALDFQKVMIELVDPETGLLTARAVAGWDGLAAAPESRISVDAIRPLLDPAFEVEGCFLIPQASGPARMPQQIPFTSTMNGRGPHAWDHHWLVVPLHDEAGEVVGRIWADDPADRLLPSPSRLQALRVFANQAMMAVIAAGHVEQLRAQADRDSLTGMLNRRAFMRELNSEIERSLRYGRRFVLALCDLDDFKSINDTAGHPAGDRALEAVAALLEGTVRATDFAFRVGGDEFALLLPETGAAAAEDAVGRIVAALAGDGVLAHGLGISFGLALFPVHGKTPEELIRRADQALYAAKRSDGDVEFAARAA